MRRHVLAAFCCVLHSTAQDSTRQHTEARLAYLYPSGEATRIVLLERSLVCGACSGCIYETEHRVEHKTEKKEYRAQRGQEVK